MACIDCGNDCMLITTECLCQYTPLKGFDLVEFADVLEDANSDLINVTVCDMCENFGDTAYKYQAIIDNRLFRRYYAKLIYYHWLLNYGSGKPSANGIVSKASDDFSEFRVHSGNEIKGRVQKVREQIEAAEEKFLEFFIDQFPSCIETGKTECEKCGEKKCCCDPYPVTKGSSHEIFGLSDSGYDGNMEDFGSF